MPDVVMPRLSDTMTEGVIAQWLVAEGDEVRHGDILAEIETDKAVMELEAYDSGTLTRILVPAGTAVPIGEPLAVIGESGATTASSEDSAPAAEEPVAEGSVAEGSAAGGAPGQGMTGGGGAGRPATVGTGPTGPATAQPDEIRATPLVRSLARERGIDLATVRGSGPNGRIIRADLEAVLAAPATPLEPAPPSPAVAPPAAPAAPAPAPAAAKPAPATSLGIAAEGDEILPLSRVRRVTAARLTESAAAPHFHVTMVADVAALLAFRGEVNAQLAGEGAKISVTDLLIKACASALRAHPEVNSSWGGDHIVRRGHVNVGVAVALEEGLIVPVVRDADRLTLREVSARARDLGQRARAGALGLDEFTGGTFTISNLGMFGVVEFNAVINPPEAAILAVGAAVDTPRVVDGAVTTVPTIRLNLTVDHRVLDGAGAAAFLRSIVDLLENPLRIVT